MSDRLSAFNRKINEFYWQVKEHLAPKEGRPCFTREEMRHFEEMRPDEIRLAFKMRLDDVEICWPTNWSLFRLAEQSTLSNPEGAARAKEILQMLKTGSWKTKKENENA